MGGAGWSVSALPDAARETPPAAHSRTISARTDLILEGDRPDVVRLVLKGLACRYQTLPDGGRQVVALLIPEDFRDFHVAILEEMDRRIALLDRDHGWNVVHFDPRDPHLRRRT